MMNKPKYFYELACCNCPEKDRCLEQKEKKESLINALFSYIENESNKITIGEIKNQIPTLTRCDVVLEKQLQRLKAENERLNKLTGIYSFRQMKKYKQALEEVKQLLASSMDINLKSADKHFSLIDEAIEKVNEVLK